MNTFAVPPLVHFRLGGGTGTTELLEPLGGVAEADGKSWNINGKNVEKHGQTARYDIYIYIIYICEIYIYIYIIYIYIIICVWMLLAQYDGTKQLYKFQHRIPSSNPSTDIRELLQDSVEDLTRRPCWLSLDLTPEVWVVLPPKKKWFSDFEIYEETRVWEDLTKK